MSLWPAALATLAAGAACLVVLVLCSVRFPGSPRRAPLQALLLSCAVWCSAHAAPVLWTTVPTAPAAAVALAATVGAVTALWYVQRTLLEATWVARPARVLGVWSTVQLLVLAVVLGGERLVGEDAAAVVDGLVGSAGAMSWDRVLLAAYFAVLCARTRFAARSAPPMPGRPLLVVAAVLLLTTLSAGAAIPEPDALGGIDVLPWAAAVAALVCADALLRTGLHAAAPPSLRDTLDSLPGAVLVLDPAGRVVALNEAARPLVQVTSRGDVLGRSAAGVLAPSLVEALEAPEAPDAGRLVTVGYRELVVERSVVRDRLGGNVGTVVVAHEAESLARERAAALAAKRGLELERGRLEAQNVHLLLELSATEAARTRLAEDSVRDALTGVHNRRRLNPALEGALAEARLTGTCVAVFVVDVDHFKRVNDTYGHPVGDRVLQAIAAELVASGRPTDSVVRYGGEEFVVIGPATDAIGALHRAEEIRQAVGRVRVPLRQEADDSRDLGVTVSVGVATYPRNGGSAIELLAAADEALYAAKDSGRDCVAVA